MKDKHSISLIIIITLFLVGSFVFYSGLITNQLDAKGIPDIATDGDAEEQWPEEDVLVDAEMRPFMTEGDALPEVFDYEVEPMIENSSVPDPEYRPVGDKKPMTNSEDWWADAKSYITSTFGVVDGQYNTSDNAPPAGSIWCAGLVSRVINHSYPGGSKIGITESVATLYNEMTASGDYEFIGEGYVSDFVDIVESTKAGDVMLLMAPTSGGGWKWSHSQLITYYGYIYSQGAGGKIRMNTFDAYNQYGAYDSSLSSGYYYYIYRLKTAPSSYLGIKKEGSVSGNAYNNVWFEAYDEDGNYLGAYMTGAASEESGGYAYYLRNSSDDLSYVQQDGGIPIPVGSTVYLYEQGVKSGSGYFLPDGASDYAGIKGGEWSYVRGPQKEYYIETTTVGYDNWTAANAYIVEEPEIEGEVTPISYGTLSLKKKCKNEYSLYTQDKNRFSLAGARYQIQSEDGKQNYYLETDESGEAYLLDVNGKRTKKSVIEDVPLGRYYCWETKASKGYKIDSECNVNKKKYVDLEDENRKGEFVSYEIPDVSFRGGLQLIKKSAEEYTKNNNNYDLKAEYTIYNSTGGVAGKINTNEQGTGYLGGLSAGKYTVKETKAGKGFLLDDTTYNVEIVTPTAGKYVYDGVDYSAVFDPGFYKNMYKDIAGLSDAGLLEHFAKHGLSEGRRASAFFDASFYAKKKGLSNYDAFKHYVGFGIYENETASPDDYLNQTIAAGVYQNSTSKPVTVSIENPDNYKKGINIEKYDKYSGRMTAEGEGTLEGAQFEVSYYAVDTLDGIEEKTADSVWHISTILEEDGTYQTKLLPQYMPQDAAQSDLYTDNDGNVFLPFGVIKIEEIGSPVGYTINDIVYEVAADKGTEPVYVLINGKDTFDGKVSVYDEAIRGGVKLEKRDYTDDSPMSGVDFEIKSVKTGETLIITTNDEGYASTEGLWMSSADDGEDIDPKEGVGALPFGEYTVKELRCDANKDKQLEHPITIKIEDELIYNVYDPSNSEPIIRNVPLPEIGTVAHEKDSELDVAQLSPDITFIDTVSYKYLKAGTEYTLFGKIMIKDADGQVSEMKKDGNPVTVTQTFKTDEGNEKSVYEKSGSIDMIFEGIDVTGLEGKSLVFYEYLYLGDSVNEDSEYEGYEDEDIFPVVHEDPEDEDQTIHIVRIGTKAHEKGSDSNVIDRKKDTVIVDVVKYENVTAGETYSIEGILYDKKTGEPIKIDGKEIKTTGSFKAENTSGEAEVEFSFDAEQISSTSLVAFETLYDSKGRIVAEHKDIDDKDQTITINDKVVSEEEREDKLGNATPEVKEESKNEAKAEAAKANSGKPKTGDSFSMKLGLVYMIIAGAMIVLIIYKKKKED